jgi:hypothetical protein
LRRGLVPFKEWPLLACRNTNHQEMKMATLPTEQRAPGDKSETDVDAAVEETFPSSVPPSTGEATKIGPDENTGAQTGSDVPGTDPDEEVPDEDTPPEPSPGDQPPDEKAT